jgi:DNA-binding GntR family transcriptional regulator
MEPVGRARSLHVRLVDVLRAAIISGDLEPGKLYSVNDLAETLQVSRTPVREALITLAGQGMVKFERNRGVRIQQTTIHDLGEVFQLRLLLEVPATRQATARMTPKLLEDLREALRGMHEAVAAGDIDTMWFHDRRFHRLILAGTGNERLVECVDSVRDVALTIGSTTADRSRSPEEIVAEHDAVMEPIEQGNPPAAAAAMSQHIRHTAELLITQEAGTPEAIQEIDLDWMA